MSGGWQFWIDRGGTFTDIVARGPDGGHVTRKLLSEAPEHYDDAALQGIRDILGAGAGEAIPAERVDAVRMGTTVATNALLERKGERTLLVVTRGFADQLRIGYQNRPRLFDLHIRLPEILYEAVVEADERMGPHGETVQPLDEEKLAADLARAPRRGLPGRRHLPDARLPPRRPRGRRGGDRAARRLRAGVGQPQGSRR